eukprot:scaffold2321_cov329-Prasinococcus_capsulatus_cf.AAC.4
MHLSAGALEDLPRGRGVGGVAALPARALLRAARARLSDAPPVQALPAHREGARTAARLPPAIIAILSQPPVVPFVPPAPTPARRRRLTTAAPRPARRT